MPPTFTGARGVYRPLVIDDAAALYVAHSDEAVHHYWSGPAHTSLAQTQAYLARTLEISPFSWAVTADGGEALGRVSLFVPRPGVIEVGVIARAAAQGRGLMSEALQCVTAYAFTEMAAFRLWADVDPDNTASLRLFERNGFARETVLRNNWKTHLGLRDSVILVRFS